MNSWKYANEMKRLNPIDDDFFRKMAEDKDFCQEILQVVMEDRNLIVEELVAQNSIKNLQGRSVILDAFCKISDGSYWNIEVQKADDDNHLRRVRYNSSCITANVTSTGTKFEEVPDVCVIFISKTDIFKGNCVVYHVDSVVRETGQVIEGGWKRIFVNTKVKDKSDVAELMSLFTDSDVYNDKKFPKVSARKRWFKENQEGEKQMSDIVRAIVEKEREEAVREHAIESVKLFYKNGVTLEPVLIALSNSLPEEKIREIYEECQKESGKL